MLVDQAANLRLSPPPGVAKRWLWLLSRVIFNTGAKRLAIKLYRKSLEPVFRHNYRCGPKFNLVIDNDRFSAFVGEREVVSGPLAAATVQNLPARPCLILGSGPSVNEIDDSYFSDCDLIVTNGAMLKCVEKGVSARIYIIQDPNFIDSSFEIFLASVNAASHLCLSAHVIAAIAERDPALLNGRSVSLLERVNRGFCVPRMELSELREWSRRQSEFEISDTASSECVGWSHNPCIGVFTGSTVAFSALQLAASLHYKIIYVGGVDFTTGKNSSRFYSEKGEGAISHLNNNYENKILPSFELARSVLNDRRVFLYSLSKFGRLPDYIFDDF